MSTVCACVLICGDRRYLRAGRRALRSVLRHSDFDVFAAVGEQRSGFLPRSSRVRVFDVGATPTAHRSQPFLRKFQALDACLRESRAEYVLLLDADALLARDLKATDVVAALGGRDLAMVEQTGIRGSSMTRADFLAHYARHSLALLAPDAPVPPLARFRYYNSGVVLARRSELERLVPWALATIDRIGERHQVGEHMVADQDYLQLWTNTLHPESCAELPWTWNHAPAWDRCFPRDEALILHLTNFCRGPSAWQYLKLDLVRRAARLGMRPDRLDALLPGGARWT